MISFATSHACWMAMAASEMAIGSGLSLVTMSARARTKLSKLKWTAKEVGAAAVTTAESVDVDEDGMIAVNEMIAVTTVDAVEDILPVELRYCYAGMREKKRFARSF